MTGCWESGTKTDHKKSVHLRQFLCRSSQYPRPIELPEKKLKDIRKNSKYMKRTYITIGITLVLTGIFLIQCQPLTLRSKTTQPHPGTRHTPAGMPENLWISDSFYENLDSILSYYRQAKSKLAEGDTLGAEIYFNQAFEILAQFSDGDRLTLQSWAQYDSVFSNMNHLYEKIYVGNEEPMEAEEIREDITALEELSFPDSVLYGEETIVDSTGPIPITLNKKVRLAIKYFQTKGRYVFTKWLERSGRYEELVKEVFKEYDLPADLAYLAMIESGFNPRARSYARAVGMWQFISATGRYYGLRHNWWFDERRDILKSTRAAAEHLRDLYERFDDWYLALAGYNCNPRKVEYNMRRYRTRDFWKLRRLPRQTRNYIPTFLAAVIIARNPEQFGFFVDKQTPVQVDTVKISESVDLNVIAQLSDTSFSFIREINPAVLRWVTPPGVRNFTIYLPKGSKERFKREYGKIPDSKKRSWVRHRIRSGEALSTIARKYHTSMSVIKSVNKLRSNFIRAGHYLLIPVPQNKQYYYARYSNEHRSKSRRHKKRRVIQNLSGYKKVSYIVKPGDTLGEIAEEYQTRASKIRYWNGLRYGEYIKPKQKLVIYVPKGGLQFAKRENKPKDEPGKYYTVQTGDTLWDIAKKYGTSISRLKKLNHKRTARIRPGERLRVSEN